MPNPPGTQIGTRRQIVIVGIVAAVGGFQVGRQSVDAAGLSKHMAETQVDPPSLPPRSDARAAKNWMKQDSSRQTKGAIYAFLGAWAENDRAAAIDYAVANAGRENFAPGINELAYSLLREAPWL
jgi:hypothetical protein